MRTTILLLLLTSLWSLQAVACRCKDPDPHSAYANADAVAVIRINDVTVLQGEITRADGEVLQAWKSALPSSLNIFTGEDCMYPLTKGITYLLYLRRSAEGEYGTYRCRGNLSQTESADRMRWLDQHGKPASVTPK